MRKLISADFYRLKKDWGLWITAAAMFALSLFKIIDSAIFNNKDVVEVKLTLNDCMFELLTFIGMAFAVFISLFLGKEFSDGTIRNKLIVGHKRENIYFSNYIMCLVGSLFIYAMMLISGFIGIVFLGKWQGNISQMIIYIIMGVFITASISAFLTLLGMLVTNRAVNAVFSIIIALVLSIIASVFYSGLSEPEFTREFISMTMDSVQYGPEIPNPSYVSGFQRQIYEFLIQFMPQGQSILIANDEITKPVLNIVYSALITVGINIAGVFAFKKKDLK